MKKSLYEGNSIAVHLHGDIAELVFDRQDQSVNKFDLATLGELTGATAAISASDARGVLVSSAKRVFIVGADIMEFERLFSSEAAVLEWSAKANAAFSGFEDLPQPTVVAISGFALGGGFEMCLACDGRVMSSAAGIGLPETTLGLIPGFGGTVRLSRLIGVEVAADWVAGGRPVKAPAALAQGAVDAVAEPQALRDAALELLAGFISGARDHQARRAAKTDPLPAPDRPPELFARLREDIAAKAGPHYPAPLAGLAAIEQGAALARDEALRIEAKYFAQLSQSDQCVALSGLFVADQALMKKSKALAQDAAPVRHAGVVGAGIMGGGIAFQTALTGTPIVMKDIAQEALDLGLLQAVRLLDKRVRQGRLDEAGKARVLAAIEPGLGYEALAGADTVIEAVVENEAVKQAVLGEIEAVLADDALLASNTSTISISRLAASLQRPHNFCGVHFFNPVHAMPLVEIIRGGQSSPASIAKAVAYALGLGKKPVVVNDCPGFLVNRVLFAYMQGVSGLIRDGVDFQAIDAALEAWGLPMGPAYLSDVVGMDTMVHCRAVLADGFPERMARSFTEASEALQAAGRLGQKSGAGFYDYGRDADGRPTREATDATYQVLAPHVSDRITLPEGEIVERCLLAMATETARCLEEGIVESAAEADLALIYGTGFPRFRGGILRWMDALGIQAIAKMSERHGARGEIYRLTPGMRSMLDVGGRYYGTTHG